KSALMAKIPARGDEELLLFACKVHVPTDVNLQYDLPSTAWKWLRHQCESAESPENALAFRPSAPIRIRKI
ncbi:MAG: hypothetical protein JSV68_17300, partial [Anaerolineaceae bacterium]